LDLRIEYPDIKELYDEWKRLETKIHHQQWSWCRLYRPTNPIRAFGYRFVYPWLWKKKLQKRDAIWDQYQLSIKLVQDY